MLAIFGVELNRAGRKIVIERTNGTITGHARHLCTGRNFGDLILMPDMGLDVFARHIEGPNANSITGFDLFGLTAKDIRHDLMTEANAEDRFARIFSTA